MSGDGTYYLRRNDNLYASKFGSIFFRKEVFLFKVLIVLDSKVQYLNLQFLHVFILDFRILKLKVLFSLFWDLTNIF